MQANMLARGNLKQGMCDTRPLLAGGGYMRICTTLRQGDVQMGRQDCRKSII